jgi:hypothetical protein
LFYLRHTIMLVRYLELLWYEIYILMKKIFYLSALVILVMIIIASCKSDTKVAGATMKNTTDTTGFSQAQAIREQHIIDSIAAESEMNKASGEITEKPFEHKTSARQHSSVKTVSQPQAVAPAEQPQVSDAGQAVASESENAAKEKKGISKTAKGAIIGGVLGAGTGAVLDKKNRAAGAVIGGAVGAGAGAIFGNEQDKKDGRH